MSMSAGFELYDFYDDYDLLQDYCDHDTEKKLIVGNFSRRALDKCFGGGFSSLGMEKHGNKTDIIDANSKAVKDGTVKIKIDGTIDKRCQAVKQGLVTFKDNGKLNVNKNSELIKSKELRTLSTNASHINSFEVADAIFRSSGLSVSRHEAEQIVRSLNKDDNLPLKTIAGNLSGTLTMPGGGDRALDQEIVSGILKGTTLSTKAAERARRQITVILNSKGDMPDKVIETYKSIYKNLKAVDGKVICRQNAKISAVNEGESRNWYSISEAAALTGRKPNGEPDMRTSKAKAIIRRKETGLTATGKPDLRTIKGKDMQDLIMKDNQLKEKRMQQQQQQLQLQQEHRERERKEYEQRQNERFEQERIDEQTQQDQRRRQQQQEERDRRDLLERQQRQERERDREQRQLLERQLLEIETSFYPHQMHARNPPPTPFAHPAMFIPGVRQLFGGPSMFNMPPSFHAHGHQHHHLGGPGRMDIPFQLGSSIGGEGMRFFKGGQFVPGGGRAPKGGGFY